LTGTRGGGVRILHVGTKIGDFGNHSNKRRKGGGGDTQEGKTGKRSEKKGSPDYTSKIGNGGQAPAPKGKRHGRLALLQTGETKSPWAMPET